MVDLFLCKSTFIKFNFVLLINFFKNLGFQWNGNWAMNCDWVGGDFKSILSRGEDCYTNCLQTVGPVLHGVNITVVPVG